MKKMPCLTYLRMMQKMQMLTLKKKKKMNEFLHIFLEEDAPLPDVPNTKKKDLPSHTLVMAERNKLISQYQKL